LEWFLDTSAGGYEISAFLKHAFKYGFRIKIYTVGAIAVAETSKLLSRK